MILPPTSEISRHHKVTNITVTVINRPSTNHLNESSLDKWLIVTFGSNKFLSTDTKINRNDVKNEKETEKWNWTFFSFEG